MNWEIEDVNLGEDEIDGFENGSFIWKGKANQLSILIISYRKNNNLYISPGEN